jgi:hypothetical protein
LRSSSLRSYPGFAAPFDSPDWIFELKDDA